MPTKFTSAQPLAVFIKMSNLFNSLVSLYEALWWILLSKLNASNWWTVIVRPNGSHSKRHTFLGHLWAHEYICSGFECRYLRAYPICVRRISQFCANLILVFCLFGLTKVQNVLATEIYRILALLVGLSFCLLHIWTCFN